MVGPLAHFFTELEAIHAGHFDIGENEIERVFLEQFKRLGWFADADRSDLGFVEGGAKSPAGDYLIIEHEDQTGLWMVTVGLGFLFKKPAQSIDSLGDRADRRGADFLRFFVELFKQAFESGAKMGDFCETGAAGVASQRMNGLVKIKDVCREPFTISGLGQNFKVVA